MDITAESPSDGVASAKSGPAFGEISRLVRDAGLMRPRTRYYVAKISLNLVMLAAGWVAFALVGDSWWQVAVAAYLAFCFTQTDFVGHDAGHRQITHSQRLADAIGLTHGNLLTGVTFGWWVGHHTKHHNYPNHLSLDPDILRRQVIFAPEQRQQRTGALTGFIVRHQSWLFFVLILLEGLRLHMAGFIAARRGALKRNVALELFLTTLHLAAYLTAVFFVLSPARAVVFILVHQGLFGLYMGLAFAPNHKGLPVRDGADDELDWVTRQVVTSRNLLSSPLTDMLFGGLNYQIEHHLFPSMPRVNLRHARPIVRDFCLAHGLPYVEVTVRQSYQRVSEYLGEVSGEVRQMEAGGVAT
jgi:fatty acid desaturase